MANAELFQQLGQSDEARKSWQRGLDKYPNDITMYLGYATLEMQTGRPQQAVACLQKGLERDKDNPDMLHRLIEAYLQLDQAEKAQEVVKRLDKNAEPPPGLSDYLAGRICEHGGKWDAAIRLYDKTAREPEATLASRAWLAMGNCYEHLGDARPANVGLPKGDRHGAVAAAGALRPRLGLPRHGQDRKALEQYHQIAFLPHPPETIWVLLARTLLQRNLALPPSKRGWDEVGLALDNADKWPAQAVPAALLRADVCVACGDLKKARTVLDDARAHHGDDVSVWTALATLAARGTPPAAAASSPRPASNSAIGRSWTWPNSNSAAARMRRRSGVFWKTSRKAVRSTNPKSKARVDASGRDVLPAAAAGRRRPRLQAAGRAEIPRPANGHRLARPRARAATAFQQSFLAELKTLEGDDGTWWRYGEAARRVLRAGRGDRSALGEARDLLSEMAKRRPKWARVALLGALLDDFGDDPAKALDGYLQAFALGERQPTMVRHLVQRLAKRAASSKPMRWYARCNNSRCCTAISPGSRRRSRHADAAVRPSRDAWR